MHVGQERVADKMNLEVSSYVAADEMLESLLSGRELGEEDGGIGGSVNEMGGTAHSYGREQRKGMQRIVKVKVASGRKKSRGVDSESFLQFERLWK